MRISRNQVTAALPCAVAALAGFPTCVRVTTWRLDPGHLAGGEGLALSTR